MLIHLPSFNLDSLTSVDESLTKAEEYLGLLADMLEGNLMLSPQEKTLLAENMALIRRFYEKAELLILTSSKKP